MNTPKKQPQDVKEVFMKCGTCSQTFGHLLNSEFGNQYSDAEFALDPLAGGIANQGHQCGMLWGATLAIGAEAYRRFPDQDQALAISVTASQKIVDSFVNRTKTVNCKEIINYDLSSVFGLVGYMLKTMSKGIKNSQCFNLAEDWAPEAIQSGSDGLDNEQIQISQKPVSCASKLVKKMGGTDREALLVSGFAGGLALSGNACGALGAAIWYRTLKWCEEHPGKRPAMFNNQIAKKLIRAFKNETQSCMECNKITSCKFKDINDHSAYIRNGGCDNIINVLSKTPT